VARLAPEKGHYGLLQAFLQAHYVADCELVLVGDGPERENLERDVKSLGLDKFVTFKGALPEEETLREIAASDILVLASFMEGLPVVLMEAMALGKPVIAPNLAGIPDLVLDQENGWLFHPADWDHLADQLEIALDSAALRSRFASEGRQTVKRGFDIDIAVEPLLQRFSQLQVREIADDSWIRASELA
jgi:glycosyltransferase involved in cell wall biosynthesis